MSRRALQSSMLAFGQQDCTPGPQRVRASGISVFTTGYNGPKGTFRSCCFRCDPTCAACQTCPLSASSPLCAVPQAVLARDLVNTHVVHSIASAVLHSCDELAIRRSYVFVNWNFLQQHISNCMIEACRPRAQVFTCRNRRKP